ncbi:MAG: hypothetical protein UZ11_BCD004001952 [Bacteroidetes bacterium OLB11]|nr:MAG: hypothetical protein UZ11_BCD004001952 [Bacteroidetes bacterium OLB11]
MGSKVRILKSKEIGVIKQFKDERALITIGNIEMNVGIEKLELILD